MKYKKINRSATVAFAIAGALYAPCGHSQEGAIFENKGGLNFETADGNFTFGIFGRIQADAAFYDEDVTALGNGTEFRRARIGASGTFYEDWGFKSEFDFADEVGGFRGCVYPVFWLRSDRHHRGSFQATVLALQHHQYQ